MEFTFTETVKLATKGYKPSDVAELSQLDENKFSKDDILSLISNGYSKSEVKKLVEMFDSTDNDETDDQDEKPKDEQEDKVDPKEDDAETPEDKRDDIDYKKKYEEEKKLREELQHKKAASGTAIKNDTRSDIDIATEIAAEYY